MILKKIAKENPGINSKLIDNRDYFQSQMIAQNSFVDTECESELNEAFLSTTFEETCIIIVTLLVITREIRLLFALSRKLCKMDLF